MNMILCISVSHNYYNTEANKLKLNQLCLVRITLISALTETRRAGADLQRTNNGVASEGGGQIFGSRTYTYIIKLFLNYFEIE